jgi:hypothetical protein
MEQFEHFFDAAFFLGNELNQAVKGPAFPKQKTVAEFSL